MQNKPLVLMPGIGPEKRAREKRVNPGLVSLHGEEKSPGNGGGKSVSDEYNANRLRIGGSQIRIGDPREEGKRAPQRTDTSSETALRAVVGNNTGNGGRNQPQTRFGAVARQPRTQPPKRKGRALLINGVMGGGSGCTPADPLSFPGATDAAPDAGDDAIGLLFLGGGGGVSDDRVSRNSSSSYHASSRNSSSSSSHASSQNSSSRGGMSQNSRERDISDAPHRVVPSAVTGAEEGERPRFRGNVLERERKEREAQRDRWRRDPPEFFISM